MKFNETSIGMFFSDKRIRFIITGGMNTLFSFVTYSVLLLVGIVPHLAVVIMYPLSIFHSYLWNKFFTFRAAKRSGKEAMRFTLVYIITFGVNYGIVYALTSLFSYNPFIAGIAALSCSTVLSYLGHSRFSFSPK